MATYFDATEGADDLAYLPSELQRATNLALVAATAEQDVIDHYTCPLTVAQLESERTYTDLQNGHAVFLAQYEADAADVVAAAATDSDAAAFLVAMKRTIAAVIVWRINQERDVKAHLQSESVVGAGFSQYRGNAHAPFPSGWDRWLRRWDTREPLWAL